MASRRRSAPKKRSSSSRRVQGRRPAGKPVAHRQEADQSAAEELVLFIDNTSDLSLDGPSGQGRSVLLNALRKWRKGTYDPALAVRLFEYLVESGAKRYAKEFDSELNWSTMFNPATRYEVARELEASFRSRAQNGEYDHVDTRTGTRENSALRARRGPSRPTPPQTNVAAGRRGPNASAEQFFYQHAGFSYPSGADEAAKEKSRRAGAKALARAEAEAERRGWTVEWTHSENPDTSWMDDDQLSDFESGRVEILDAVLRGKNGEFLGSLGEVGLNAHGGRDPYARVVEAELAQEALAGRGARETRFRAREDGDEDGEEMWINAEYNEAPWLAQHWYSGQGDPLYALASAGFPQPESTVEWALRNARESEREHDKAMVEKYGKRGWSKIINIDPESSQARKLNDDKREDLQASDEITRLVLALEEALRDGERISKSEGWAAHGKTR